MPVLVVKLGHEKALRHLEEVFIGKYKPTLNTNRAFETEEDRREQVRREESRFYHRNKGRLNKARRLDRVECECGSSIRHGDIGRHEGKKRHQKLMAQKQFLEDPTCVLKITS
mgnify:CR=1 FL=1